MARLRIEGFDELIKEMEERGEQAGKVADAMLLAAAEVSRQAWQESANKHGHKDTGQLIASIGYPRQPKDMGGAKGIDIYPQGKDHKGVRNAEKAFILHYGTSKRPGSHWVDDANAIAGPKVGAVMQDIWDEYITTGNIRTVSPAKLTKERSAAKKVATAKYHSGGQGRR